MNTKDFEALKSQIDALTQRVGAVEATCEALRATVNLLTSSSSPSQYQSFRGTAMKAPDPHGPGS